MRGYHLLAPSSTMKGERPREYSPGGCPARYGGVGVSTTRVVTPSNATFRATWPLLLRLIYGEAGQCPERRFRDGSHHRRVLSSLLGPPRWIPWTPSIWRRPSISARTRSRGAW